MTTRALICFKSEPWMLLLLLIWRIGGRCFFLSEPHIKERLGVAVLNQHLLTVVFTSPGVPKRCIDLQRCQCPVAESGLRSSHQLSYIWSVGVPVSQIPEKRSQTTC